MFSRTTSAALVASIAAALYFWGPLAPSPSCVSLPTSPSLEAAESFAKTTFDYVVIGGGNAGLPVAARLSENPKITVGVIEAGFFHQEDPLIDVPGYLAQSNGNPKYDWSFSTAPQSQANGRSVPAPRGKMVGGSSALNFMAWDRASKPEYDAWKELSDSEGWNWDSLLDSFRKHESADSPASDPFSAFSHSEGHVSSSGVRDPSGTSGPVKVSYNPNYTDIIPEYVKGWNTLGIPTNTNPYGGNTTGVYNTMSAIDRKTGTRSDAAKAYYCPASHRKNFIILTGAQATKIMFSDNRDSHGNLVAHAVSFEVDGKSFTVNASKEMILSAGVVQTPQLLELSGIGDAKLLRSLNVNPLVDLPGVGENLQDHIFAPIQFLAKPGYRTYDELRINPVFMAEQTALYESSKKGWLATTDSAVAFLPMRSYMDSTTFDSKLKILERSSKNGDLTPLQKAQYDIQLAWLKEGKVPDLEIGLFSRGFVMPEPDKTYFVVMAGIQHPFSRGSVHVNSTDPFAAPIIDPRYLSHEFDLETLVAGYRLLERFAETAPAKKIIESVSFPPAPFTSDVELSEYIRNAFASGSHLMGSCVMARRELGGVVGSDLRVHGTANLRIADTSIIPMPIAAHIQATAYAIGEKAAYLIKKDL